MKITVTGAVGRLGQYVVRALHAEGHQIVATDQIYTRDLPVPVELLDLQNSDGCYRLLEGSDILVHLGNIPGVWQYKPQRIYNNNVNANANVFQAALDTGVGKILFASSVQTFSGERYLSEKDNSIPPSQLQYLPLDGQVPANPGNLYGASKIAGENLLAYYAKQYGLSTVAIRFPFLPDPGLAEADLERVRRKPLLDEGFSYLALNDAADLVVALVKADLPGFRIYLPASPGTTAPMSVDEIVTRYYPDVPRRAQSKYDNLVDVSQITSDTGWIPRCRLYGV